MSSESFPALLGAAAACALLMPIFVRLAPRAGLLDVPNARSSHVATVPRGGGIAVLLAAAGATFSSGAADEGVGILLVGAAALGAVGLLDDLFQLPAPPRLAAQFLVPLVCSAVAASQDGIALVVAIAVSITWCVSYVNAFNFMDGINGISASHAAVTSAFLALVARHIGSDAIEIASWTLCGSSLAFLPFNAVRPRAFLGDVGSYGIGFWLAATGLLLWRDGAQPAVLLGPFVLYLADTSTVLARRKRRGSPLFEAHREHAYQRLTQAGWSHVAVAALCAGLASAGGVLMLIVIDSAPLTQLAALGLVVVLVAAYLKFVATLSADLRGVDP